MKVSRFAKSIVLLNCAVPLILLAWDALAGRLGANPVNFAIRTTGILALIFIILTLAVTPVSRITGWGWLGQFRRILGLYAFFHASLHFLIFFWFDREASVSGTLSEITMRTYLMVGTFVALGAIVAGMLRGFNLGLFFCFAMVALSCGYIVYQTSNILHHYRTEQYVAAALALFASVALLFWYILQILMSTSRR